MKLSWTKCPCGHPSCDDWHIENLGKFCQGSGFSSREREILDNAFAAQERLNRALSEASRERDQRIADLNEPGKYQAP